MTEGTGVAPAAVRMGERPPPAATTLVEARGLAAAYGARPIWQGASFDIRPGEFVAILGPNGAGKSTLFRILLGLMRAAAGELTVLGGPPRRGNPAIGYVPQRRPVDPESRLVGAEFVRLGLNGHRWGLGGPGHRRAVETAVADALEAVDGSHYGSRSLGSLSGGELQRLSLAQAIVSRPSLLLLDEPFSNLDVRNQVAEAQLFADLARRRTIAVLLIAHDINPLLPVLDRVMYIARGRVSIGTPDEVITSEHLSALYDAHVEVLRDHVGRLFVVGLEDEASHPHDEALEQPQGGSLDVC